MKNLRFSLFFALIFSIAAPDFAQAMKRLTETPDKKNTNVISYCHNIIDALQDDNVADVKKGFIKFYNKVACNTHITQPEFYKALSFCLCNSLSGESPTAKMYDEETNTMAIALTYGNTAYILQFRTVQTNDLKTQPEPVCTYALDGYDDSTIDVIDIAFLLPTEKRASMKIDRINNNGLKQINLESASIKECEYTSDNFYTRMILTLTESSSTITKNRISALSEIYNAIPKELRIANEKFYQSILFCIITFFRSSFAETEKSTARGRADIMITGDVSNSVLEFKFNVVDGARKALTQIINRDYSGHFNDSTLPAFQIGINIATDEDSDEIIVTSTGKKYEPIEPSPMKPKNTNIVPNKKQKIAEK